MNCPVTCGRPTRMRAEAFARMCAARRDYGNGMCVACGGRPENWPDELTTIEGGKAMASKTIKELSAEALAPVKAELEDREARVAELEYTLAGTKEALAGAKASIAELEAELATWQEANRKCSAEFMDLNENLRAETERLRGELTEARQIIAQQEARRQIGDGVDLSSIYRDALADFAIRVLSGGVAVSFHEARP